MKLTIARKITLIGLVSITGLVSLSILRDQQLTKLYNITHYVTSNTVPSLVGLAEIRGALDHIDLSVRRYLITQDANEMKALDADLMDYQMQASQSFDVYLKNNVSDDKDRELMTRAQTSYAQYMQKIWSILPHYPQTRNSPGVESNEINQDKLKALYVFRDSVDDQVRTVADYNLGLINKYQREAFKAKKEIGAMSAWVTLLIAIINICLVALIRRSTIKQLGGEPEQVVETVSRVIDGYEANIQLNADKDASMLNKINHLVLHDRLTQLPNRLAFSHQIQQLLRNSGEPIIPFSFFKIELNGIKGMTEVLERTVTSALISVVIHRLQSAFPDKIMLAILDAETFGLLIPNDGDHDLIEKHANKVLDVFSSHFRTGKQKIILTANIGIVCYPADYNRKDNLFDSARLALMHAKKLGGNRYQFYRAEFSKQRRARLEIEGALHHALENNELELYYQPQVDINTEQIIGAEALIRWKHPTLGMVQPDHFIPIAEESGSIVEIGDWVLVTAFKAATLWNAHKTTPIKIAINLSPRQFLEENFVSKISSFMDITGCKPAWIKFEITEGLMLGNSVEIMRAIVAITELGVLIAMDDFGTGYSSLSYLTSYPISQIKIDRSFINDIPTRLDKCEVIKMIMLIAEKMQYEVVVEGVETPEQIEYLRKIKCNVVQGYYYYKPMPFNHFDQIVTSLAQEKLKQEAVNEKQYKKNRVIQFSSHQA